MDSLPLLLYLREPSTSSVHAKEVVECLLCRKCVNTLLLPQYWCNHRLTSIAQSRERCRWNWSLLVALIFVWRYCDSVIAVASKWQISLDKNIIPHPTSQQSSDPTHQRTNGRSIYLQKILRHFIHSSPAVNWIVMYFLRRGLARRAKTAD